MKFRECNSINSKENIQVGYRDGSRIVNWYVNKTFLSYGADTNLSFIITYEISMNSTENIPEDYWNGLATTALELKNCKQQLFTLTTCLPACLWGQTAKTPL